LLRRFSIHSVLWVLWLVRRLMSKDRRTYVMMNFGPLQPVLEKIGMLRAEAVYLKARRRCPAYRRLLEEGGHRGGGRWSLAGLPVMTKENYVKKYGIEERCYDGRIPAAGVVIDESSGSSGVPNNWVRSAEEREDVRRILQLNYQLIYRDSGCILLNCFALGPWATGMNVSMSLVDVGILKSVGPDQQKLENTLELFGTGYRYLVFGYPPFVKSFVDTTRLDLARYRMDLVVGGEGISEAVRTHLLRYFKTVISSYGASDLEINIGVETELTINLRRRCMEDGELSRALFGRETPPMIFQYNPVDYIVENNEDGELLFTIGRQTSAAPKIRYNLRDVGGTIKYKRLERLLAARGVDVGDLARRRSSFPLLYVYGRSDLTVPFYGAKLYPSDVEEVIHAHPLLAREVHSFQLASYEDARMNRRLKVRLETVKGASGDFPPPEELRDIFFDGLCRFNQDFREVAKMFSRDCVETEVHAFESGPFGGRDIRVKNKYVSES
jgi:phenylacetate-coenzyme A ligase PaaK-like adenylate-forming protein